MKQIASSDFRKDYMHETAPIEVTAYGKVVGIWYPAGTEPASKRKVEPKPDTRTPQQKLDELMASDEGVRALWIAATTPEVPEPEPTKPIETGPNPRENPERPSIRPVKRTPKAMVGTSKRIVDAQELRRQQEREQWSRIQARLVTSKQR